MKIYQKNVKFAEHVLEIYESQLEYIKNTQI